VWNSTAVRCSCMIATGPLPNANLGVMPSSSSSAPSPADAIPASGTPATRGVLPAPRLWRSRTNRVVLGVIGGLAEKLGWEAKPLRILWGFVGVITIGLGALPAIIPYLALWGITQARGTPAPTRPFRRSRKHHLFSGLLGGVADWLGVKPWLVRVGYVGLTSVTLVFPGIVAYLVLWAKTPVAKPDANADSSES
jgi:phage shock protein C